MMATIRVGFDTTRNKDLFKGKRRKPVKRKKKKQIWQRKK